eukprot:TRINITY_DN5489_c0_g1_i6.p8 TRINITY_DN5489_c0_g1~~TRINITY_DN5489_c0_g1_i6.p8  ORF type:complete len:104 (-),score=0.82 TRINITY_DN5489_c0_g1_i6:1043-1354(-)
MTQKYLKYVVLVALQQVNYFLICGILDYPMRIDEYGVQRFDPSQINRDRIELWTWQAADRHTQIQIGQHMKNVLDVPDLHISYRNHHEVMAKRGHETITYTLE